MQTMTFHTMMETLDDGELLVTICPVGSKNQATVEVIIPQDNEAFPYWHELHAIMGEAEFQREDNKEMGNDQDHQDQ